MLHEIMLPNFMNCTILNIRSSIIYLPFMQLTGQSMSPVPQESSLEGALNEFKQIVDQPIQKSIDAIMANIKAITRLEGQLGHLLAEFNKIKE
jgi:hypothetical protein